MTWDVVLLATKQDITHPTAAELSAFRTSRTPLSESVWFGELKNWGKILDGCLPPGYAPGTTLRGPGRAFDIYGALVCDKPSEPSGFAFDSDTRLRTTIALSRLVFPNPLGWELSARLDFNDHGTLRWALPFEGVPAFGVNVDRSWLTIDEWKATGTLLRRWPEALAFKTPRIRRALRCREKAAQEYEGDFRVQNVVTAVEALVGFYTPHGVPAPTKQGRGERFVAGATKLAENCGIGFGQDDAWRLWDWRSHEAHGATIPLSVRRLTNAPLGSELVRMLQSAELLLSCSLRKTIEDDGYAANFGDDSSVLRWLP